MIDTVTVSTKGWVVIPAFYRRRYDLSPGKEVRLVDYGGVLALVPPVTNPVQTGYGLLRGDGPLTQVLLSEHNQELSQESRRGRDDGQ